MKIKKILLRLVGLFNIILALIFLAWSIFSVNSVSLDYSRRSLHAWSTMFFFCLLPLLSIAFVFAYVGLRLLRLRLSMWICDLHIYVLGPAWLLFAGITFYYTFFQIHDLAEKSASYLISFFSLLIGCVLIISFRSTSTMFKKTKT